MSFHKRLRDLIYSVFPDDGLDSNQMIKNSLDCKIGSIQMIIGARFIYGNKNLIAKVNYQLVYFAM